MSTLQIIHLAAMGLAFVVWAFFMFSMLLRLSRRSVAKTAETGGGFFSWVRHSLSSFSQGATSAEDRALRLRIICSAVTLAILIALSPVVANLSQ